MKHSLYRRISNRAGDITPTRIETWCERGPHHQIRLKVGLGLSDALGTSSSAAQPALSAGIAEPAEAPSLAILSSSAAQRASSTCLDVAPVPSLVPSLVASRVPSPVPSHQQEPETNSSSSAAQPASSAGIVEPTEKPGCKAWCGSKGGTVAALTFITTMKTASGMEVEHAIVARDAMTVLGFSEAVTSIIVTMLVTFTVIWRIWGCSHRKQTSDMCTQTEQLPLRYRSMKTQSQCTYTRHRTRAEFKYIRDGSDGAWCE